MESPLTMWSSKGFLGGSRLTTSVDLTSKKTTQ